MTPEATRDAIRALAVRIAAKSTSAAVDGWAGEITALADTIPGLVPTIVERRTPGERRQQDTKGSPMRRTGARRGGGTTAVLPPPAAVIETMTVTSAVPPTFAPTDTHQITVELKDRIGVVYNDRTVTYSSGTPAAATVSAGGLVTGVAAGTSVITVRAEGLTATVTYTVTSPIATVTQVTLSSATASVTQGSTTTISATPKDAGGNVVLGQTVTWSEVSGAGDVTLSADSGPESHTVTITGVTAGDRLIKATSNTIDSSNCTVTVNAAASGTTDSLGIFHELLPAGYTPFIGCLYGSSNVNQAAGTTGVGCGATRVGDYWKNFCEGADNNADNVAIIETDATTPFQTERAVLYPGHGGRCGYFRLQNGQAKNNTFANRIFFDNTSNRYNSANVGGASPGYNVKPRRMYWRSVWKFQSDFPSLRLTKFGFMNYRGQSGDMMLQLESPNDLGTTSPWSVTAWNLQGTWDNNLTDNAVLTNSVWGGSGQAPGYSRTTSSPGGLSMPWVRDVWYDIVRLVRMNTYDAVNPTRDGSCELWRRGSTDGVTWSSYVRYANWTGNILQHPSPSASQDYWAKAIPQFMSDVNWNGGYTSGIRAALDYIAFGELE